MLDAEQREQLVERGEPPRNGAVGALDDPGEHVTPTGARIGAWRRT